jgi:zinc transport system substrate-binding protein
MLHLRIDIRLVWVVGLVGAAALIAAGCGDDEASSVDPEKVQVVAAFYPLAWAAEQVGGSEVQVTNLTPSGAEPHDLELSPRDLDRLRNADVVLYLGGGFQPALEDAIDTLPDRVRTVDLLEADGLETIRLGEAEGEEGDGEHEAEDDAEADEHADDAAEADEHGHEEGGVDPHVWLDPARFVLVTEAVGDELGEAGATAVDDRLEGVVATLRELDADFEQGLADCQRREVFTSHDAFSYWGERFELHLRPISLGPEAEPKPRDIERLAEEAKEADATTIYFETLVSPRVAQTLASEVGATTAVLDPLEGLTDEAQEDGEDYPSVMRDNLERLQEGLGCPGDAN